MWISLHRSSGLGHHQVPRLGIDGACTCAQGSADPLYRWIFDIHCMACRCRYLTQTLGDAGVVRDAVKGQASPRQSHDIETRRSTPVQHQLCILIVELLAIIRCADELQAWTLLMRGAVMAGGACIAVPNARHTDHECHFELTSSSHLSEWPEVLSRCNSRLQYCLLQSVAIRGTAADRRSTALHRPEPQRSGTADFWDA
jgi:hypothetical protein